MFCCSSRKPCLTDVASSPVGLVELTMGMDWFLSTHTILILAEVHANTHTRIRAHAWLIKCLVMQITEGCTLCALHVLLFILNPRVVRSRFCFLYLEGYEHSWIFRHTSCICSTRYRMHLDLQRWWSAPSVWPVSPGIIGARWFDLSLSCSLLAAQLRAVGADSHGYQD